MIEKRVLVVEPGGKLLGPGGTSGIVSRHGDTKVFAKGLGVLSFEFALRGIALDQGHLPVVAEEGTPRNAGDFPALVPTGAVTVDLQGGDVIAKAERTVSEVVGRNDFRDRFRGEIVRVEGVLDHDEDGEQENGKSNG